MQMEGANNFSAIISLIVHSVLRSPSNRTDKRGHVEGQLTAKFNYRMMESQISERNRYQRWRVAAVSIVAAKFLHLMRNGVPPGEQVQRNHECQIVYWPQLIISGVCKNGLDKIAPNRAAPSRRLALSSDLPKTHEGRARAARGRLCTCKVQAANLLL